MTALSKINKRRWSIERSIERSFHRATPEQVVLGIAWYNEARKLALALASQTAGVNREQVACAIAHLSPRQTWAVNQRMAAELVTTGDTKGLHGAINRAKSALAAADPFTTFGAKAHKTRSFAHNITGNLEEVTVDVWVLRVVGITEVQLGRVGVYQEIADAYRRVAARLGIAPAVLQAITWIQVRGFAS